MKAEDRRPCMLETVFESWGLVRRRGQSRQESIKVL